MKIAVDNVLSSHPLPIFLRGLFPALSDPSRISVLIFAASLLVGVSLLVQLEGLGSWLLKEYTAQRLIMDFRSQLFRHVQRLSLVYHDVRGTVDSLYRIQYDAPSLQYIAVNGIIPFLTAGFGLAAMIYVIARIDWQLAVVALAVSPVLFLVTQVSRRRFRTLWSDVKKIESSAMGVIQETLAAIRVVRAFGQEEREQERFIRRAGEGMRGQVRLAFLASGFDLCVGLTIAVGTAVVLLIGVRHVQAKVLTLGDLLLVTAYLTQLYGPLDTIAKKAAELQSSLASAERAFALLDEMPDVVERPSARSLRRASGAVAFRHVSFGHDNEHIILHDISFDIDHGRRVGIVGVTGAGKTTLVSLLIRFYDPTNGQVLLDGVDLRDYRLADLRNQFAVVLQEPVLFATTIAENIAYGNLCASLDDIIAAARAANAHEFIGRLTDGYETMIGERGMTLSGGERQRIALARAFLKDAPILILDEPTSSVDMRTEATILEAVERLMQGRTTFIITHRPSLLSSCDIIMGIENGRLVSGGVALPGLTPMPTGGRGREQYW